MHSRVMVGIPLFVVATLALLEPGVWLVLMLIIVLLALREVESLPGGHGGKASAAAMALFAIVASGVVASGLLRMSSTHGLFWVVLISVIVIANDTFALLIGRRIGEHSFFPSISPNKTREGAVGGIAVGCLVGYTILVFASWQNWGIAFWPAVVLCLVIPLIAVTGDLFESKVKRMHGVKDMGTLLPGHGGVIDRIDALSAAWLVGSIVLVISGSL